MRINVSNQLSSYIQADPLKAFRFLVEIEGEAVGAFSRFSGVRMEVKTIRARSGNDPRGVQEYIPVFTEYEPVTLTKGVFGNNGFMDWIFAAAASSLTGPTGSDLRRTIDVIAMDDAGRRGVIWTLTNAMPIRYELSAMDGSRSEVLTESVTFAIEGVERTVSSLSLFLDASGG